MASFVRLALLALALVRNIGAVNSDESADSEEWRVRPAAKVVKLLNDMSSELQAEAKTDEESYDKQACWCRTNDAAKTKAIADATQLSDELEATIEQHTSQSKKLGVDIATLDQEISKNKKALEEATSIRAKERAEFNAQDKELIVNIASLKGAVVTLSKQNAAAAFPQESLLQVRNQVRRFNNADLNSLLSGEHGSGEIFGILSQMKEEFEANKVTAESEEKQAEHAFKEMKGAKATEVKAGENKVATKSTELSASDETAANAKTSLRDTTLQLRADQEFLSDLKQKCAVADKEYETRRSTRQDEITAVSETIGILTSDDAKDSFSSSMGFVQLHGKSALAEQAARVLRKAGLRLKNPSLMAFSTTFLQMDVFSKMKQNIDGLISGLEQAQKDDVEKKDYCRFEFNENDRDTAAKRDAKADLEAKVADLESRLSALKDDIAAVNAAITETQIEMKKASTNRETEHKDFAMTIADQRATQAILQKAHRRMEAFYKKKAVFLQESGLEAEEQEQEPMPESGEYEKSAKGGGVLKMLEGLVHESKTMQTQATFDNHESQMAYEEFMVDSNKMISSSRQQITDKSEQKAMAQSDHVRFSEDLTRTNNEILALGDYAQQMHGECDFLMKNFETRQNARQDEIDALNQAKQIFSQ